LRGEVAANFAAGEGGAAIAASEFVDSGPSPQPSPRKERGEGVSK
jgi:hypothetical protein